MRSKMTIFILVLLMLGTMYCGNGGIDNGVSSTIDTQNQQSNFGNGRDASSSHPIPE